MVRYTITPWRTQADLLQVRAQLYDLDHTGNTADARRAAISRVMAWKLRGHLPHAVESTAVLVDAIMHHQSPSASERLNRERLTDGDDEVGTRDNGSASSNRDIRTDNNEYFSNGAPYSDFSIRAVYGAAFCRFVTGFCDIGRQRERNLEPASMLEVARQIDMPAYFVALRHEATHDELPGIPRLVAATNDALSWLWRVYWSRLEEDVDPKQWEEARAVIAERVKTQGVKLLRDIRKARVDALKGRLTQPELGEVSAACDACVELCGGRDEIGGQMLAALLVKDRLILPSTRELGSSMDGAFLIWDEFIDGLDTRISRFRGVLVRSCLDLIASRTMDPTDDVRNEALKMWILHMIEREDQLAVKVIKFCCLHPGIWTQRLGEELLHLRETQLSDWKELFFASNISDDMQSTSLESEHPNTKPDLRLGVELYAEDVAVGGWKRTILPSAVPIGVAA